MKIVCTNVIERLEKKRITSSEDLKIEKVQRKNLLQGFWQDWRTSKNKIEIFSEVTSSQEEERSMKEEEKENLSDVSNGGSTCSSKDKNEKISSHKEATIREVSIRQVEYYRLHHVEEGGEGNHTSSDYVTQEEYERLKKTSIRRFRKRNC